MPQFQEDIVEVVKVLQQAPSSADGANRKFTAAEQEQSTFEGQPSVLHADMNCTAAWIDRRIVRRGSV